VDGRTVSPAHARRHVSRYAVVIGGVLLVASSAVAQSVSYLTVNDDTYSHATMWNVASCATVAAHIDSRSPVAAGVR
jgi:hypothetical protein